MLFRPRNLIVLQDGEEVNYASVRTLQLDPSVLHEVDGGDDCLLFRRTDFNSPQSSKIFGILENHSNPEIKRLGNFVREQLAVDLEQIPNLQWPRPDAEPANHIAENLGNWLNGSNVKELLTAQRKRSETVTDEAARGKKLTAHAQPLASSEWVKPTLKTQTVNGGLTHSAHSTNSTEPTTHSTPSLTFGKRIRWRDSDVPSPIQYQILMLMNPLVWIMCSYLWSSCTTDLQLKNYAHPYETTVTHVGHHLITSSKSGRSQYTDVRYSFKVNDKTFYVERSYPYDSMEFLEGNKSVVYALPSNPMVHEQVGALRGGSFSNDMLVATCLLSINLFLEYLILVPALRHWFFAKFGTLIEARVEELSEKSNHVPAQKFAVLSYIRDSRRLTSTVMLSEAEFLHLQVGTKELVFCDPVFDHNIVIAKFCLYKRLTLKAKP